MSSSCRNEVEWFNEGGWHHDSWSKNQILFSNIMERGAAVSFSSHLHNNLKIKWKWQHIEGQTMMEFISMARRIQSSNFKLYFIWLRLAIIDKKILIINAKHSTRVLKVGIERWTSWEPLTSEPQHLLQITKTHRKVFATDI